MNDGQFYVSANLRVKFLQDGREGGHMRNISMYEYRQLVSGEKSFQEDLDSLKKRVKVLEDTISNNILPRIQSLEDYNAVSPDDDGDGVANFRDREPNTPKGSFVNFWGESIPQDAIGCCDEVKQVFSALGIDPSVDYDLSVYYDFDKYSINAKDYSGGIVGNQYGSNNKIIGCYSSGTINRDGGSGNYIGRIVGWVGSSQVQFNYTTMTSNYADCATFVAYNGTKEDCAAVTSRSEYYMTNCQLSCTNITEFLQNCYSEHADYFNFNNTWTWTGTINGKTVNVSCPKLYWED
jgi:hypothetical protein